MMVDVKGAKLPLVLDVGANETYEEAVARVKRGEPKPEVVEGSVERTTDMPMVDPFADETPDTLPNPFDDEPPAVEPAPEPAAVEPEKKKRGRKSKALIKEEMIIVTAPPILEARANVAPIDFVEDDDAKRIEEPEEYPDNGELMDSDTSEPLGDNPEDLEDHEKTHSTKWSEAAGIMKSSKLRADAIESGHFDLDDTGTAKRLARIRELETQSAMETPAVTPPTNGYQPTPATSWEDEADGPAVVDIEALSESPSNPRRTFPDEKELVASIRQHGVLQPLLVRPTPTGLEIVAGHRRFRAAKLANLRELPVTIRHMDDVQTLEAQLTENLQRSDLHPMEEAEGYQMLHERHGLHVEKIAEKVNKSRAYVYSRLKLIELTEPCRKLFYAGKLNPSTALLIARIPDPKMQAKAALEITGGDEKAAEPMSYRAAFSHIQDAYMLRLSDAPFSPKDEFLVPDMGACGPCKYRTGNALELFGDIGRTDVCTLPSCFARKTKAHWENEAAKAMSRGCEVLTIEEGKKLYRFGSLPWDSKYVELHQTCHDDPSRRTWKQLLGDLHPPITVAPDLECRPKELILRADAVEALRGVGFAKLGKSLERPKEGPGGAAEELTEEIQRARDVRQRTAKDVLGQMVAKVEKSGLTPHLLRAICFSLIDAGLSTGIIRERRGIETEKGLLQLAERKLDGKQLAGFAFELAMVDWLEVEQAPEGFGTELKAMCKALGVDLKQAEGKARNQVELERHAMAADELFKSKAKPEEEPDQKAKAKPAKKREATA